jgi:hypothetical protein
MRDRIPIFAGLFIFVALFTFPLWRGVMARTVARQPELSLPVGQKDCVLPREQMRQAHMQLLVQWREDKVRHGVTTFTAYDGKQYPASLTGTCLTQCHTNKAEFCDRCHQYSGVSGPYCFDCHVDPKHAANASRAAAGAPKLPESGAVPPTMARVMGQLAARSAR